MGRGILKSRAAIAVFTCAITAAAAGGVSYAVASGSGSGTTFYACSTATGAIRASSIRVGTPPTSCKTGETVQSWNEQGQPGAQGPVGQASVVTVGTPADCSAPPSGTTATTDTTQSFLDIPSLPGESTDPAHLNQIDVQSWSLGLTATSSIGSACSGAAGRTTFRELTITKHVDKASPGLMLAAAQGTNLGTVTLHVTKQAGTPFLTYTFGTVFTTKVSWKHSDDGPTEDITFVYGSLKIAYTPQTPTDPGGTLPPVVSCFDAINQTVCSTVP